MTQAFLRLDRRLALGWILVCAADPLFRILGWTAANKTVLPTDPQATLLGPALAVLALGALPLLLALYTWVLTRIAPRLRWWAMAPAILAASAAMLAVASSGHGLRDVQLAFLPGTQALRADFEWTLLAGLPWARLLVQAGAIAAVTFCIPALLFARAAGVRWFVPLAAVMAAGMTTAAAGQAWLLTGDWWSQLNEAGLNGWSWTKRTEALCLQGGLGALWGAISAGVFLWLAAPRAASTEAAPATVRAPAVLALSAILVLAPPCAAFMADPFHAQIAWNAMRNATSRAPATDTSTGESLVRFQVASTQKLRDLPWRASFSPDASTVIAIDAERRIVRIATATGETVGTLGERLALYENPDWAWSADGRWFAVRTWGAEQKVGIYSRHQPHLRLYAVPGYRLVADYSREGPPCMETSSIQPLFEPGGEALWIGCATFYEPKPDELLALRLSVPALQVAGERRYGDLAPLALRGMALVRGSIWSWHHGHGRDAQLRVRDVSADREAVRLAPNPATGHGNAMTLQDTRLADATVSFRYAVGPERGMQTFVHDSRSGALLRVVAEQVPRRGSPYDSALETPQGLRIESRWQPQSKAGELTLIDAEAGVRQRVQSVAQRLLSVSDDGRWLATQSVAGGQLRIYRIAR